MTTTAKIRELAEKFQDGVPMGFESVALLKDAARMAELLERAEWLLKTPVERETVDEWQKKKFSWWADFQKFQDDEND